MIRAGASKNRFLFASFCTLQLTEYKHCHCHCKSRRGISLKFLISEICQNFSNTNVAYFWFVCLSFLIQFFVYSSCSVKGATEREFLANIESIVRHSSPHEKMRIYFADPEVAKMAILNKVTFCSERIKVWPRHNSAFEF